MTKRYSATQILLALNALVFVLVNFILPNLQDFWVLMPLYFPENERFRLWQFVSSMFMHGDLGHLFFNMFALLSFGSVLERVWGAKRFVIFYMVVGLGAGLIYTGVEMVNHRSARQALLEAGFAPEEVGEVGKFNDPRAFAMHLFQENPEAFNTAGADPVLEVFMTHHVPVVGASGAIYGILTAFGLLFPEAKLSLIFLPIPVAAKFFIPALLLMDLFSGVTGFSLFGGGIAHFAHLGGAFIGFILMMLWKKELSGIDPGIRFG